MSVSQVVVLVIIVLVVALAAGAMMCHNHVLGVCRGEDDDDEGVTPTASFSKIIITDQHVGAWMMTDDSFTGVPAGQNERQGVLFQLGSFEDTLNVFNEVRLDGIGNDCTSSTFDPDDVAWINVVAQSAVPERMNASHVPMLTPQYPAGAGYPCGEIDRCTDSTATNCAGLAVLSGLDECVRFRKLHRLLAPKAIMTYWNGPNGFNVDVPQSAMGGIHHRYEFELRDPVRVEVWLKDPAQPQGMREVCESNNVTAVVVGDPSGPNHGGSHNPPWPQW